MTSDKNRIQFPTIDDFYFLKTISRGGYGRVYLATKKIDEKKTKYAIKSKENIYLAMEYMIGGDLMSLLCVKHTLETHEAQFYAAEIAVALDYLHQRDVIHRDVKPDNVLISATGHIKLTDLGLSEIRNRRKVSIADVIGTPSVCKVRTFRTPGQIISLTSDFSFSSSESDSGLFHTSTSSSDRSTPSSRIIDCTSLRIYRQPLHSCIPENGPLAFENDERDGREFLNADKNSNFLFSSPKRYVSNMSQTIKQRPRIHHKTISRLLASSPAHQNQHRLWHEFDQSITSTIATTSSLTSPSLSPIRNSFNRSQFNQTPTIEKSTNIDDNIISVPIEKIHSNRTSLSADDSLLKQIYRAQNYSTGRISSDITTDTSIQSSFLKSPVHPDVFGPVFGTPDYLSPEILMQDEYPNAAGDFWALGICLYQFFVGITPFSDDSPHAIISNILNYRLLWPENDATQLSDDAINVIKGLLNYDPTLRFQLNDLKNERFFSTINWDNLANMPAPFIPKPDDDSDTFYFDARNKAIGLDEESTDCVPL